MKLVVRVGLKEEILDPQGEAIANSLKSLGFENINSVRQGKTIELDLDETNRKQAVELVTEMCDRLLVNKIIENFAIEEPS
jgi:phosphoribosylformylglycinamidine synthase PurS subunit